MTNQMFSTRELYMLRERLAFPAFHYLRASTYLCANGLVKAQNHREMSEIIFSFLTMTEATSQVNEHIMYIHDETSVITDYLDEKIGLPLETPIQGEEWDIYVDRYINLVFEMLPELYRYCFSQGFVEEFTEFQRLNLVN